MGKSDVPKITLGTWWVLHKRGWRDGLRFQIDTMKHLLTVSMVEEGMYCLGWYVMNSLSLEVFKHQLSNHLVGMF